ncbi:MAG: hypothetical protein GY861_03175 [bacterium]|nr:hypothetical protein [bacterium]
MDIRILQERIEENKNRKVYVLNPTSETFVLKRGGKTYEIAPNAELEIKYPIAEFFVRKIVDYMVNKKLDTVKIVSPQEREELEKRVRLYDK